MPRVDNLFFGGITLGGRTYSKDIIIFSSGEVVEKERNHLIDKKTIQDVLLREPELIIIGTGHSGLAKIDPTIELVTKIEGVEVVVKTTREAVDLFNKLYAKKKVAAVLHTTC